MPLQQDFYSKSCNPPKNSSQIYAYACDGDGPIKYDDDDNNCTANRPETLKRGMEGGGQWKVTLTSGQ